MEEIREQVSIPSPQLSPGCVLDESDCTLVTSVVAGRYVTAGTSRRTGDPRKKAR
jgi:hypothetical protein